MQSRSSGAGEEGSSAHSWLSSSDLVCGVVAAGVLMISFLSSKDCALVLPVNSYYCSSCYWNS